MSQWQRLSTKIVYQNTHITVHEDSVIRPDGVPTTYGWIETPPAVMVVAVDQHGKVLLVRQNRYTIGQDSWELPAGSADTDDELTAAKRELAEEAGLHADNWEQLPAEQYPLISLAPMRIITFVAKSLHRAKEVAPADDVINKTQAFTWTQLKKMIAAGEINQSATVAAVLLAGLHLGHIK